MKVLSERGSAILLVLILLVIVALVTVASYQLIILNKNSAESVMQDNDMTLLQTYTDRMLKQEASCRIALGGPLTYGGANRATAQTFDPAINFGNSANPNPITLYQNDGATTFISATLPLASPNNKFGKLTISGINLIKISPVPNSTDTYLAQMFIGAQKTGGLIGASNLGRNSIRVSIKIDGTNKIISCSTLTFLGSDVQALPVCSPGQALYSNGATGQIRCVQTICPAPKVITGYMLSGDVICM